MKKTPLILIADRNPYVRKLLQRELIHAGYQVLLAENGRQVLLCVERLDSLDLVILDPDLPDMEAKPFIENLRLRIPHLPLIVHGHPGDDMEGLNSCGLYFVEKRGNSIDGIFHTVREILGATEPAD